MTYSDGIYGFFGDYRYLSNYQILDEPVCLFGFEYFNTEAAYQAAKSIDPEFHKLLSQTGAPLIAKQLGSRTNKKLILRPDWEKIRENVMYEISRQKFDKNSKLKEKLKATGDKYLEETNWWNDDFWGCCVSGDREEVLKIVRTAPSTKGLNRLGWCLMSLRLCYA